MRKRNSTQALKSGTLMKASVEDCDEVSQKGWGPGESHRALIALSSEGCAQSGFITLGSADQWEALS